MPGRRATPGQQGANNSPSSQPAQIPFDNHKIRSILMPRMIRGVRQIESLDNSYVVRGESRWKHTVSTSERGLSKSRNDPTTSDD